MIEMSKVLFCLTSSKTCLLHRTKKNQIMSKTTTSAIHSKETSDYFININIIFLNS